MLDFLSHVLPTSGNYVLSIRTEPQNKKSWHRNYHAANLQDVADQSVQFDAAPGKTVFYALGSFKDNIEEDGKVRRTQEHAHLFRTLAFDVDPEKDGVKLYNTQREMAAAALKACSTIGLPDPVFVSSGHGLHCYYPLTSDISKALWVRISIMLRDALLQAGMLLDTSKVCDASMVLRPIGTTNKKRGGAEPVRLLSPMTTFDPVVLTQALQRYVAPTAAPAKPARKSSVLDAILHAEFPPANAELLEQRCAQIMLVASTGGTVDEPLWHKAMGIAKHCINPNETAHRWSDQDPRYTHKGTEEKLAAWKTGPTTCKVFESINKSACVACPHRGNITSPIQLGVEEVSQPIVTETGIEPRKIKNYFYRDDKIFRSVDGEAQFVSDYLIFPSGRYKCEETGKTICLAECKLPKEGWHTHELSMDVLASTSDFQVWLINHQLFVYSKTMVEEMRKYMLTYLQELQLETESDMLCSSFGWVDDTCKQFVLGTRLISKDETREVRLSNVAADFAPALIPRGDKAAWKTATRMFNEPGMEIFGMSFLMSVASPLMVGSGLKSVLVNMYSQNSGTGKTTTGHMALSAYGNPGKLALTVQDTDNSVFKTMGVYGNLPVYIDEITSIERERPGRLSQTVYFVTQGREKRRMNKDGGFQESVEWESIAQASSNMDMYPLLNHQMTFEGESSRILQFSMPDTKLFMSNDGSTFGYEMALFMQRNYGLAGEDFIRGIITAGGPHAVYEKARLRFIRTFGFTFTGKERFWQAAVVCGYAAGLILNALGLADINVEACVQAALIQIAQLRKEMTEEKSDCFDTLGQFVSENANRLAVYKKNISRTSEGRVEAPYPHEAVTRIEILCKDNIPFVSGRLFIDQVELNRWCKDRAVDRKAMMAEFAVHGVVIHKDRRISLMRGTDKPIPAVRVLEIELSHPRFADILKQNGIGVVQVEPLKLVKS